jgi:type IV secretory pathway TrbL component
MALAAAAATTSAARTSPHLQSAARQFRRGEIVMLGASSCMVASQRGARSPD